jgi:heme-degrading monooxygenase HmoA
MLRPVAGEGRMIIRIWRGWTTRANADRYEALLRDEVFPGIFARRCDGFEGIQLMRRELGDEVEFMTAMRFRSLADVRKFAGEDFEVAVVPPAARAVLARFDASADHYVLRARHLAPDFAPDPIIVRGAS